MNDTIAAIMTRPATDADSPRVIEIIDACFQGYPGCVMDLPGLDADLPAVASHFARLGGEFRVAERAGAILGCGGYAPLAHGLVELKRLYVSPDARRLGIASQLLNWVIAAAKARDAREIGLWSDTRFIEAHVFYLRHGFTQTGETRDLDDPSNTTEYRFHRQL